MVFQIGNASRLADQLLKILFLHQTESPIVQLERVNVAEAQTIARHLVQVLNERRPALVVLVCDADKASELPELGRILGDLKVPCLAMLKSRDSALVIRVLESGFQDYFIDPLREVSVWPRIQRHLPHNLKWGLIDELGSDEIVPGFLGRSHAVTRALADLATIAPTDLSVLITGETGTGKEVCARAIHQISPRKASPFNPINCGAIPSELFENELFGHESGAYTGAKAKSAGLIEQTEGGTLFLDEIDTLSLSAQVKLLRFLEAGESRALGSSKLKCINVRILAATNADLAGLAEEKRFRLDVLYRLNVVHLHLPPLREREGDVELLAQYFLTRIAQRLGKPAMGLSSEASDKLAGHDWPGNVRQLKNLIERTVARCRPGLSTIEATQIELPDSTPGLESYRAQKQRLVDRFEKTKLLELLLANRGNISRSAKAVQMNRQVFARKLARYGIVRGGIPSGNSDMRKDA